MKINMDEAKIGQTVIFRNGGRSVISRIEPSYRKGIYLCVDNCIHGFNVTKAGRLLSHSADFKPVKNCPFDITGVVQ